MQRGVMQAKKEQEIKQRKILGDRLAREERARAVSRAQEAALAAEKAKIAEREERIRAARDPNKPPEVEKAMSEKYAAIDDVGERAFAVLRDLGFVGKHD